MKGKFPSTLCSFADAAWHGSDHIRIDLFYDEPEIILKALETFRACQDAANLPSLYIQDLIDLLPSRAFSCKYPIDPFDDGMT